MTSTLGRDRPVMKSGERLSPEKAMEIVKMAVRSKSPDGILVRTMTDWNMASTVKARTEASVSFAPFTETVDFTCRRIGPGSIGLYAVARNG